MRAVAGPAGRHAALIEDAFKVLVETPGGGVSLNGGAEARRSARQAIETLAGRVASRLDVTAADARVAIDQARTGDFPANPGGEARAGSAPRPRLRPTIPGGPRRSRPGCSGLGPAGTGKTFRAVAHGAHLLRAVVQLVERLRGYATGRRGRRAAWLSAWRPDREGRSLYGPGLGGHGGHSGRRGSAQATRARRDRGGADRFHARPNAFACLCDRR